MKQRFEAFYSDGSKEKETKKRSSEPLDGNEQLRSIRTNENLHVGGYRRTLCMRFTTLKSLSFVFMYFGFILYILRPGVGF